MHNSSGFFQGLFEAIGVGIRITDEDGKILAANDYYCALYGYTSEELKGKNFTSLISPAQRAEALRQYKQQFQLGTQDKNRTNWTAINKGGEAVVVTVTGFNIRGEDGKKYRVGMVRKLCDIPENIWPGELQALVLENVKDSVVVAGLDGKILYWNRGAVELYGYTEKEVVGKEMDAYWQVYSFQKIIDHFKRGNNTYEIADWFYCHPGGQEKYIDLSITPLLDEFGDIAAIIFVSREVSEKFRQGQEIREQQLFLASLLDSQTSFLIRLSPEGHYTYCNKAFYAFTGYEEGTLSASFQDHIHANDLEAWQNFLDELHTHKKMLRIQLRIRKADKSFGWVNWEFIPLQDHEGAIRALQAVGIDVSAQKRVEEERDKMLIRQQAMNEELQANEEELRQNLEKTVELKDYISKREQKFKSLLENSFEAIILFDAAGYIQYASPSIVNVLGYTAEEMTTKKGMFFVHEDDKDNSKALLAQMMEKPRNKVYIQQRVRKKDGSYIWVDSYTTNLLDDEHVKGIVSNFRDITERMEAEEKLRANEAFLNAAQRIAKLGSVEFDLATGGSKESEGVYAIYDFDIEKHPKDEFSAYEYLHPGDEEKIKALFQSTKDFGPAWIQDIATLPDEVLQQIESTSFEYRIISAAGKLKYIRSNTRFIRDEHGKPVKIILTLQDVSEERYLQHLLDETSQIGRIGGWELNMDTGEVFWTRQTYKLFDIPPEENLSIEKALEFYEPEYRAVIDQAFQALIHEGTSFDLELKMHTAQGKERWVRLIGESERVDNRLVFAKGTMQDITEIKEAEEEVRAYAERLRLATEAAGIGIYDWDLRNNKLLWDRQMFRIYGFQKEFKQETAEVSYEEWKETIHPDDPARTDGNLREALKKEQIDDEYKILLPSGEVKWIKSYARVFHDEQGEPLRMIGVNWDISLLKQIEEVLRRNNDELSKINQELDHFVYSTSHNLRAPLTSILGIVDLIRHYENPAEYREYIRLIEKSVHKLDETIQEITNYSRNTRMDVALEPIDFDVLIQEVIESLSFLESAGKINISYILPADSEFYSDSSRLKMIFTNLVSNAIKYADPEKEDSFIHIEIYRDGEGMVARIKDNGIGIAPEYQERIFNMFYRASTRSTGSGLGLYIVKEAVQKLEGSIRVSSKPGEGSEFIFHLPRLI